MDPVLAGVGELLARGPFRPVDGALRQRRWTVGPAGRLDPGRRLLRCGRRGTGPIRRVLRALRSVHDGGGALVEIGPHADAQRARPAGAARTCRPCRPAARRGTRSTVGRGREAVPRRRALDWRRSWAGAGAGGSPCPATASSTGTTGRDRGPTVPAGPWTRRGMGTDVAQDEAAVEQVLQHVIQVTAESSRLRPGAIPGTPRSSTSVRTRCR